MAARIAMIATTIINSINVKPRVRRIVIAPVTASVLLNALPRATTPDRRIDREWLRAGWRKRRTRQIRLTTAQCRNQGQAAAGPRVADAPADDWPAAQRGDPRRRTGDRVERHQCTLCRGVARIASRCARQQCLEHHGVAGEDRTGIDHYAFP